MYLTANEAMDFLKISRTTLQRFISDGTIKAYKPAGRLFFNKDELSSFIENSVVKPLVHVHVNARTKEKRESKPYVASEKWV